MKILYIATSFPEPQKGATIYTDLAEALHEAGHHIVVVVSEQTKNKTKSEMKKERGFNVLRIVTGNYYDVNLIQKGITTLKMPIIMKNGIKKYLKNEEFDFILFEAPPVTNGALVDWAKHYFKCYSYLMLKDIFPQNAVDLGIMKSNGLLFSFFERKEKRLYKSADIIGCMSNANINYVINHNKWLDKNKVEIFPNTKKIEMQMNFDKNIIREKYKIPKDACVFLFGGNMGRPQYVELLCQAIKECKADKNVFFVFVGRGTDRYKLEDTIKREEIGNALILENLPRTDYEEITKASNVGLIVLDPRFTIPNYPSRILSYMEYSKPILAATDKITDIKDLILEANCGEWVCSDDNTLFINKIKEMANDKNIYLKGKNGREYLEKHFKISDSVKILEKHFN